MEFFYWFVFHELSTIQTDISWYEKRKKKEKKKKAEFPRIMVKTNRNY